jgi:alpha-D-xyloside xylohydrolase
VFARSATVGGQKYPVHWGGDSTSTFVSMAESMRAGLSLCLSGFSFWSHDISGFEDTASPEVYMRWAQFGLLSSHSRLHGSSSYRVPWLFGERAPEVVRQFTSLKCRLMPYLYAAAVEACETGLPMMRAMVMEFPSDRTSEDLDRQYMLGGNLLVAPVFREDNVAECYLPNGKWTHLLTGEVVEGGAWRADTYDYGSLPLFVRENSLLVLGASETQVDYDYLNGLELRAYQPDENGTEAVVVDSKGEKRLILSIHKADGKVAVTIRGAHKGIDLVVYDGSEVRKAIIKPEENEAIV